MEAMEAAQRVLEKENAVLRAELAAVQKENGTLTTTLKAELVGVQRELAAEQKLLRRAVEDDRKARAGGGPVAAASVLVQFYDNTLYVYGDATELKAIAALNPNESTAPWKVDPSETWGPCLAPRPVALGFDALGRAGYRPAGVIEHFPPTATDRKHLVAVWTR
jgi:hypothetical protein